MLGGCDYKFIIILSIALTIVLVTLDTLTTVVKYEASK